MSLSEELIQFRVTSGLKDHVERYRLVGQHAQPAAVRAVHEYREVRMSRIRLICFQGHFHCFLSAHQKLNKGMEGYFASLRATCPALEDKKNMAQFITIGHNTLNLDDISRTKETFDVDDDGKDMYLLELWMRGQGLNSILHRCASQAELSALHARVLQHMSAHATRVDLTNQEPTR